jgi:hypothetical protein
VKVDGDEPVPGDSAENVLARLRYILLVVGIIGALLSMVFWSSWAGPGYWSSRRRTTVVAEGPAPVST